jgi:hypothetical protein
MGKSARLFICCVSCSQPEVVFEIRLGSWRLDVRRVVYIIKMIILWWRRGGDGLGHIDSRM